MTNPFEQIISLWGILIVLIVGAVGFLLAFIISVAGPRTAAKSALIGLEAVITTMLGAILAQLTVAFFIWLGGGTKAAEIGTSFFFLIWPGIVNLVAAPFTGNEALIGTSALLWIALGVGAGIGFYDGFHRIHRWMGPGVLTFLGDLTWGLPLNVNAFLIHLINTGWGDYQDEPRNGAHRYKSGFCIKGGYAFTQGNCLSALDPYPPLAAHEKINDRPLYKHEQTHVLQNRIFGPIFWMTYFGWLILFGFFAIIFWILMTKKATPNTERLSSHFPMWWAYFNNPWELWAYTYNPNGRVNTSTLPMTEGKAWCNWPGFIKVLFTILGEAVLLGLILLSVWLIWF